MRSMPEARERGRRRPRAASRARRGADRTCSPRRPRRAGRGSPRPRPPRRRPRRTSRRCRRAHAEVEARGAAPPPRRRARARLSPMCHVPRPRRGMPHPRPPSASVAVLRVHARACAPSLFSALMYALAEATTMSVSAPMPFTMRPFLRQAHGHLALRVGALGHVVDRVEQQLRAALHQALDRLEGRVHLAVAARLGAPLAPLLGDHHARERLLAGLGVRRERDQLVVLASPASPPRPTSAPGCPRRRSRASCRRAP